MLSGTSCALVPSGKAVWLKMEEWNMHWPKIHFFSGNLSTMLLTFLSFSLFLMQQTPRAIVVKCDGSVYDVEGSLDLPERPELPERPPKYRKDQRIIGGYFLY